MKFHRFIFCIFLLLVTPKLFSQTFTDNAVTKFRLGNFDESLSILQSVDSPYSNVLINLMFNGSTPKANLEQEVARVMAEAKEGEPEACYVLGMIYANGLGLIKVNHDLAFPLFTKAAEAGLVKAQFRLGIAYLNGFGTPKSETEAKKWYQLAIDKEYPPAMVMYGGTLVRGGIYEKNIGKGLTILKNEAAKGSHVAESVLGMIYWHGQGVERDPAEGLIWLTKSAKGGVATSQFQLGSIYQWGIRAPKDERLAYAWYNEAYKTAPNDSLKKILNDLQVHSYSPIKVMPDSRKVNSSPELARVQPPPSISMTQTQVQEKIKFEDLSVANIDSKNKRALVIGNDSYLYIPRLTNARRDSTSIAGVLRSLGYKVTLENDLNEKRLKSVIRKFKSEVNGGDQVVLFYAGHGVQIGSTNYLLPTDIRADSEEQVKDEGIQLQRLLDDMSDAKAKLTLAVIDACRDNPFPKSGRAIGGRGLAPTTAATGQMVVFSAGTGQQALDKLGSNDKDPNGLFTRVLLKEMRTPGIRVDNVIREVRKQVVEAAKSVGHEQVPAIYDQVVGDFYFSK